MEKLRSSNLQDLWIITIHDGRRNMANLCFTWPYNSIHICAVLNANETVDYSMAVNETTFWWTLWCPDFMFPIWYHENGPWLSTKNCETFYHPGEWQANENLIGSKGSQMKFHSDFLVWTIHVVMQKEVFCVRSMRGKRLWHYHFQNSCL